MDLAVSSNAPIDKDMRQSGVHNHDLMDRVAVVAGHLVYNVVFECDALST